MTYINHDGYKICKRYTINKGDILIQEVFTAKSKTIIVPSYWDKYVFKGCFRLYNFKISCNFLNTILNSNNFKENALKKSTGSIFEHLSVSILKEIKIKIPKDKSLIDSLNPTFNEIDSLNEEIPKQEKLYQQYLNELKSEAIKED